MLPGLRTLAAAVLLTFAVVTFAFGAAALLRSAHDDFAVLQTWRPAMEALGETVAAKELEMPVLAALRIEPEPDATERTVHGNPLAAPEPPPAEVATVAPAPPAEPPAAAVVAALPEPAKPEPTFQLPDAPYNAPLNGPRLMPEIATNDAAPVAFSLASVTPDAEPLDFAPLPRPRPQFTQPPVRKRIVRRTPARSAASSAAAQQTQNPFQQLFGTAN